MSSIGLIFKTFNVNKMGDSITLSSIPENLFKTSGEKIVDMQNLWVFDHNPYVLRGVKPDSFIDFDESKKRLLEMHGGEKPFANFHQMHSIACGASVHIGGPRLYKFEDVYPQRRVCVHVTPKDKDCKTDIPQKVLDRILKNYESNYEIVQIGASSDAQFKGAKDLRGLPIWESVKVIASSEIFIGTSSGPLHIADCYPRVRKKVLLFGSKVSMLQFLPRGDQFVGADWINYNWEYYSPYEQDLGATRTYLHI